MTVYVPHTANEEAAMLSAIGVKSATELYGQNSALFAKDIKLPNGKCQQQMEREFSALAEKNKVYKTIFRGAGAYKHYVPPVVKSIVSRQEFLTAYTPYQAELSQGILQSIFEYQTMIANLTGMDVSNASHYDGATAFADAIVMMAERNKKKVLISSGVNPMTLQVIETYLKPLGLEIVIIPLDESGKTSQAELEKNLDNNVFAFAVSQPNFYGIIEDTVSLGKTVKEKGVNYVMQVEPFSQTVLPSAGESGADAVAGEGQPLGLSLSFGGPYLGFLAVTKKHTRKMVGRIVGKTKDTEGKDAYVLTLQAREQHIRREKASSSICSNQAHCALTAAVFMAAMGESGLSNAASQCVAKAHYLSEKLKEIGFTLKYYGEFFNEFVTVTPQSADKYLNTLEENGVLGGLKLSENEILWCATEANTREEIDFAVSLLKEVK